MNSLNRVQLIGNVTREPELQHTKAGQPVTTIGVATNRNWTDGNGTRHDDVEFHNVVCWGRLAEIACTLLRKGAKVFFSGRLQTRSWVDDGGVKHFRTEIIAEDMISLTPKGYTGHESGFDGHAEPTSQNYDAEGGEASEIEGHYGEEDDGIDI